MAYTPDTTADIREQINAALEYIIVSGIPLAITPEIHIGDVHLLNIANAQVNPATEDGNLAAIRAAVHNEDEAYTPEDAGIPVLLVRKDARGLIAAAADGDYTPGQVNQSGEFRTRDDDANTALSSILTAANKATVATASVLYDGGGADNALVEHADAAALIAAVGSMTVIDTTGMNTLDIFLMNSVAAETCTLWISEYDTATPTVASLRRQFTIPFTATDGPDADRASFGLVADATEYPTKAPDSAFITPGRFVLIALSADLGGGAWYLRYQLRGDV